MGRVPGDTAVLAAAPVRAERLDLRRARQPGAFVLSLLLPVMLALEFCSVRPAAAQAQQLPFSSIDAMFNTAQSEGRVGQASKTRLVDARPALPGEVIVTVIAGEGVETLSKPAQAGDMVVRNRCAGTGNEQYLVKKAKFASRYAGPVGKPGEGGWKTYKPLGSPVLYFVVRDRDGSFTFTAPWGEAMVARPEDAMVRSPADPRDTYRVAAGAFSCTYRVHRKPGRS